MATEGTGAQHVGPGTPVNKATGRKYTPENHKKSSAAEALREMPNPPNLTKTASSDAVQVFDNAPAQAQAPELPGPPVPPKKSAKNPPPLPPKKPPPVPLKASAKKAHALALVKTFIDKGSSKDPLIQIKELLHPEEYKVCMDNLKSHLKGDIDKERCLSNIDAFLKGEAAVVDLSSVEELEQKEEVEVDNLPPPPPEAELTAPPHPDDSLDLLEEIINPDLASEERPDLLKKLKASLSENPAAYKMYRNNLKSYFKILHNSKLDACTATFKKALLDIKYGESESIAAVVEPIIGELDAIGETITAQFEAAMPDPGDKSAEILRNSLSKYLGNLKSDLIEKTIEKTTEKIIEKSSLSKDTMGFVRALKENNIGAVESHATAIIGELENITAQFEATIHRPDNKSVENLSKFLADKLNTTLEALRTKISNLNDANTEELAGKRVNQTIYLDRMTDMRKLIEIGSLFSEPIVKSPYLQVSASPKTPIEVPAAKDYRHRMSMQESGEVEAPAAEAPAAEAPADERDSLQTFSELKKQLKAFEEFLVVTTNIHPTFEENMRRKTPPTKFKKCTRFVKRHFEKLGGLKPKLLNSALLETCKGSLQTISANLNNKVFYEALKPSIRDAKAQIAMGKDEDEVFKNLKATLKLDPYIKFDIGDDDVENAFRNIIRSIPDGANEQVTTDARIETLIDAIGRNRNLSDKTARLEADCITAKKNLEKFQAKKVDYLKKNPMTQFQIGMDTYGKTLAQREENLTKLRATVDRNEQYISDLKECLTSLEPQAEAEAEAEAPGLEAAKEGIATVKSIIIEMLLDPTTLEYLRELTCNIGCSKPLNDEIGGDTKGNYLWILQLEQVMTRAGMSLEELVDKVLKDKAPQDLRDCVEQRKAFNILQNLLVPS